MASGAAGETGRWRVCTCSFNYRGITAWVVLLMEQVYCLGLG